VTLAIGSGRRAARCMNGSMLRSTARSGIMPLMAATGRSDEVNAIQGDFGEAWLEVVAAAQGLGHNRRGPAKSVDAAVTCRFVGRAHGVACVTGVARGL